MVHGNLERLGDDLAGLDEADPRAGVDDVEGLLQVLGGQAACGLFGLGVPEVGQAGAGARAPDEAVGVALGLAVPDEDEFGDDHEAPRWVKRRGRL
ncbi:hypothetical protein ScoT_10660 [Streptomyces albidoflavus]|uniref:Uncharacterized protein n=1 Tax=Streptomyces albidoflavus TaxID=1886 RepID=A0AA37BUI0_9ACTN|nr:hypothetical protein ScoT_10660 [Streptomyces albidoflavus]